jgi:hypothetical protein
MNAHSTESPPGEATSAQTLREALRIFVGCAYPVSTEIDPRGHRWSEAYLDQALEIGIAALENHQKIVVDTA